MLVFSECFNTERQWLFHILKIISHFRNPRNNWPHCDSNNYVKLSGSAYSSIWSFMSLLERCPGLLWQTSHQRSVGQNKTEQNKNEFYIFSLTWVPSLDSKEEGFQVVNSTWTLPSLWPCRLPWQWRPCVCIKQMEKETRGRHTSGVVSFCTGTWLLSAIP